MGGRRGSSENRQGRFMGHHPHEAGKATSPTEPQIAPDRESGLNQLHGFEKLAFLVLPERVFQVEAVIHAGRSDFAPRVDGNDRNLAVLISGIRFDHVAQQFQAGFLR